VPVSLRPLFLSRAQGGRRDEIFRGDKAFERGQPMVVIARTVIGFASATRSGELLGERG
jgi:hypothetical protein